jgi:hypothetical protein
MKKGSVCDGISRGSFWYILTGEMTRRKENKSTAAKVRNSPTADHLEIPILVNSRSSGRRKLENRAFRGSIVF